MTEDWDVARSGYGHVYAQALIQLYKDLHSPVRHFTANPYTPSLAVAYAWPAWFGSHLAALERDRDAYGGVTVPRLSFAVRLWVEQRLDRFGFSGLCPEYLQEQVNLSIAERLTAVYEQGDPYLAALCLLRLPETAYVFGLNAGLRHDKAEQLAEMCLGKARELASEAERELGGAYPAAKVSMFRPTVRDDYLED